MQKPVVQIWSKATYKAEYSELGQTPTQAEERLPVSTSHSAVWELGAFY